MRLNDNEIEKLKHHFGLLGISPTNNKELIELTYHKLFNIYHPDRGLNSNEYNYNFKKVFDLNESKDFCLRYCYVTDLIQQISNYDARESNSVLNRKNF